MKKSLIILLIFFIAIRLASAEIFVSPLNEIYNYGDELTAEITLVPNTATADHLFVDVMCSNVSFNIFNSYYNLNTGQEQRINVGTRLLNPLLNNLTAGCNLNMRYGTENANSGSFILSRKVMIAGELDFENYSPGKSIIISGTGTKESGVLVNGFVEIFINSLNIYKSGSVINGAINLNIQLLENARSGVHNLTIRVYETDSTGKVINDGNISLGFTVSQILKELKIIADADSVSPGKEFIYFVNTYDQAKDIINSDISIIIYGPKDEIYEKKLIKPGTEQKIAFSLNDTPGYWKINAKVQNFEKKKLFFVEEIRKIQTSLINNTLIVTNIGNVPYNGPLEITIGTKVEIKPINLKLGETQKFKLYAPEGSYQIRINDGSQDSVLGNAFLTGNAIRVVDFKEGFIDAIGNPIIWWTAIILFISIVVYVRIKRRMLQKKTDEKSFAQTTMPQKKQNITAPNAVHSVSINNGLKENAVAIGLKTTSVGKVAEDTINKALMIAKNARAKVYIDRDLKIMLFSKRLTGMENNAELAVKTAKNIENLLNNHNRVYKDKILFGIGITDGEIISEIKDKHFRFTAIGSLISGAKKIAIQQKMKVLLSDSIHRKIANTIKTEKSKDGDYWEISKIVDRTEHKAFLDRFKKRN